MKNGILKGILAGSMLCYCMNAQAGPEIKIYRQVSESVQVQCNMTEEEISKAEKLKNTMAECITKNIELKHDQKKIEEIVNSENTPQAAFERIEADIKFVPTQKADPCSGVRWFSMQETYARGKGMCIDGAIAFAAMLSDNPKYDVRIVSLMDMDDPDSEGHAIAAYRENGKWGYVSFNDYRGGKTRSVICPATYDTIEDVITKDFGLKHFDVMAVSPIEKEKLKFGKNIVGVFELLKKETKKTDFRDKKKKEGE